MIAFEDYIGGGLFKICRESWWDIIGFGTLDKNCTESAEESCPPPKSVSRTLLHNPNFCIPRNKFPAALVMGKVKMRKKKPKAQVTS